ncbi:hypothetical protein SAMN00808754_1611 [Thermanaeromonas toyohensis ToBE]|uniref:Uncharacterized protein n=1 Tax=Thermanaeromonas toyohensis ToBE TaxID=698762 RepID=A0A1W1VTR2_9FIRM|nr:hypothetical protein SAMN00808754_1611 [Thermanaeromonas toyohensis ToBE]
MAFPGPLSDDLLVVPEVIIYACARERKVKPMFTRVNAGR